MRLVVLFIGLPVAVGLMLVSLLANWRFGIRLGADTGDAIANGLASISADGLKIVLPFAIAWAWRRRRVAEWLSAATLWLVISVYSLVSALSFAAVNRAEIGERRLIAAESYAALKSETAQKRSERGRHAAAQPADAIQVEMRALEQQPGFSASARCTAPMGRSARLLC